MRRRTFHQLAPRSRFVGLILAATLVQFPSAAWAQSVTSPASPAPPALFARVVTLGASSSAGYGLKTELRAETQLADILDCALLGRREPTLDLADVALFQDPTKRAQAALDKALEAKPSLVVAVDFLFWFGYSASWVRNKDRDAHLEVGLALLDRLKCPLLVGDLPDMSPALEGEGPFGGPLIEKHMIPVPKDLARLNARIRAWADERERVVIVPMAQLMQDLIADEGFVVHGNRWGPGSLQLLLQRDLLHPRVEGSIGLVLMALDRLVSAREDLAEDTVEWSVPAVRERLMQLTAPEREKTLEREKRREERQQRTRERIKAREGDDGGRFAPAARR